MKKKDDKLNLKRVEVKGIEFDWIFRKEYQYFLKELATTTNINLFSITVVKDVVLYMWSHF